MKTLVFCTAWANSAEQWHRRYGRWLQAVRQLPLQYAQILLVDDASPCLPQFADCACLEAGKLPADCPDVEVVFARFDEHLGRNGLCDYPGWWRSFMFAAEYAVRYGFGKVVHIESDAFLLSSAIVEYIDSLRQGWVALWCPRWNLPESCIQVICADQLPHFQALAQQDYAPLAGLPVEKLLPFTRVETAFKGDRYGEYRSELPPDADYACQVLPCMELFFAVPPVAKRVLAVSLAESAIAPHPLLYPQDSWEALPAMVAANFGSLLPALQSIQFFSLDALQLTIDGCAPAFVPANLLPYLAPGGELALHFVGREVTREFLLAAAQPLLSAALAGAAMQMAPGGGGWIMAVKDGSSLSAQQGQERLSVRLMLAVQ